MNTTKFYFIFFALCILSYYVKAQDVDTELEQIQLEATTLTEEVANSNDSETMVQASITELQTVQKNNLDRILSLEKENNILLEIIDSVKANLTEDVKTLKDSAMKMQASVNELLTIQKNQTERIISLERENNSLKSIIDSVRNDYVILSKSQKQDKEQLDAQIGDTKEQIKISRDLLYDRLNIGSVLVATILTIIIAIVILCIRRVKKGTDSIDEVRNVQAALQSVQANMQEESIKLDNKLLELIDKQLSSVSVAATNVAPDHSLALKVADEIVRIEMNLSRMDTSVKGYKQLSKAVQRIKDNFKANGYEIVDMLGKPYNAGMKVVANFAVDEKLNPGQQIITGIIKPQINYNEQMIQAAQITVSQNI